MHAKAKGFKVSSYNGYHNCQLLKNGMRGTMIAVRLCLVTLALATTAAGHETPETNRRAELAKAMAQVREGMSPSDVLKLLGKPDDIREKKDLPWHLSELYHRAWCYGTNRHLGFALLGMVVFNDADRVSRLYGQGTPVPAGMFEESQLRELLELIDRAPDFEGNYYDPLPVIQITNALQPLGKKKALTALREYLRVAPDYNDAPRHGIFLVLRVLFEIPEPPGYMPAMIVGGPSPPAPKDPRVLPRFPIAMLQDVPILLIQGYELQGQEESVYVHVEYFERHGVLRRGKLRPTDQPLMLYAAMKRAPWWPDYGDESRMINQIIRLVGPTYGLEPVNWMECKEKPASYWAGLLKKHQGTEAHWDARTNTYQTGRQ
jgi:hypothetical protein